MDPDDRPDLPEQTSDDTDRGWGEADRDEEAGRDRWLEDQRPPHHGG